MGPVKGALIEPVLDEDERAPAEPEEWDDPCSCHWGTDWTCGEWAIKRKDPYCARHGWRDADAEYRERRDGA